MYHRLIFALILSVKANFSISQAFVTDISYAYASFNKCSFESYQDTWYTGRFASTYVIDSIIDGQTERLSLKSYLEKPLLLLTALTNQISLDSAVFFCFIQEVGLTLYSKLDGCSSEPSMRGWNRCL